MSWKGKDIISITDFSPEDIQEFLELTKKIKVDPAPFSRVMEGKGPGLLFFEESSRTYTSSRNAMEEMGGRVTANITPESSSVKKGEKIKGNVELAEALGSDIIVIRHPRDGSAQYAADVADIPVINGGDGYREHPTQNLLDLFTIYEHFGRVDHLTFVFFGDLKYGRTTRVIVPLSLYPGNRFLFLSHHHVKTPEPVITLLSARGCPVEEYSDPKIFPELLRQADVAYGSRIQKSRFPDTVEGRKQLEDVWRSGIVLSAKVLKKAKPKEGFIVMHPLPRDEDHLDITHDVDSTPWAHWVQQMTNGLHARKGLFFLTAGGSHE